ncbi:MAG: hypothetical protein OHK0021_14670 [Bryobacter sp.]
MERIDFWLPDITPEMAIEVEQILAALLAGKHGQPIPATEYSSLGLHKGTPGKEWRAKAGAVAYRLVLHRNANFAGSSGLRQGLFLHALREELLTRTEFLIAFALQVRGQVLPVSLFTGNQQQDQIMERRKVQKLWRKWKAQPDSPDGQLAFLSVQKLSCLAPQMQCKGDSCFLAVIREGEAFLGKYPDSPYRDRQLFHLARAYETGWSLGQAGTDDVAAYETSIDAVGAALAREKAMGYYEKIIERFPASDLAQFAKLAIPRLKLKLDGRERHFFCAIH